MTLTCIDLPDRKKIKLQEKSNKILMQEFRVVEQSLEQLDWKSGHILQTMK